MKYPTTSPTLLDKISAGDEISWKEFYDRYKNVVLTVARHKGLDETTAEDVLQQVMLTFFTQGKTFKFDPNIAKFRTYFGRIVNAKVMDVYRKLKPEMKNISIDEVVRSHSAESVKRDNKNDEENKMYAVYNRTAPEQIDALFMTEYRRAVMADAIRKLRDRVEPETWQAYELYAVQGRPVKKVAEYLDCSVNQVYQAKKRCLAMLREIITEINAKDPELKLRLLSDE